MGVMRLGNLYTGDANMGSYDLYFCITLKIIFLSNTVNPVLSGHSKRRPKLGFKTDYRLMQVKSIAEHSAILSTFIKIPFVIMIFVLSFLSGRLRQALLYYNS